MCAEFPREPVVEIRAATPLETDRLSHVLARAFRDEPFHRWIFPFEAERARKSARFFKVGLRESIERERVLTTQNFEGVAIWRAPSQPGPGPLRALRLGLQAGRLLGSSAPRVFRGLYELHRRHPRAPVWYLTCLGTDPDHRGRGVASALLRPILDQCDETASRAHLVTSDEANLSFYRHLGFEVTTEFEIPHGPAAWEMVRVPDSLPAA